VLRPSPLLACVLGRPVVCARHSAPTAGAPREGNVVGGRLTLPRGPDRAGRAFTVVTSMPSTCHGVVWHGRYCVACPAPCTTSIYLSIYLSCTTPISGGFTRRCLGDSDPPSPSPPTHHTQGTCISGERGVLARSSCGWRPVLALRRRDVARGNPASGRFPLCVPPYKAAARRRLVQIPSTPRPRHSHCLLG